ncbi:unnamed protein product, partial [Polarella glacialis]
RNNGLDFATEALLREIQAAQDSPKNGYARALGEIRAGCKQSCWIWWIWPSLAPVRATSRPQYSMPDLGAAFQVMQHEVLGARLREITSVAVEHLRSGTLKSPAAPTVLFGSSIDATKFHESATCFAVGSVELGLEEDLRLWTAALEAFGGHLEESTMAYVAGDGGRQRYRGVTTSAQLLAMKPPMDNASCLLPPCIPN